MIPSSRSVDVTILI